MPIPLAAILAIVGAAVVGIVILYSITMFREWVQTNIGNLRNRQILSGLVRERLKNGDFKLVQFLFDEEKERFVKAEAVQASLLDDELEGKLEKDNVLIEPIKH